MFILSKLMMKNKLIGINGTGKQENVYCFIEKQTHFLGRIITEE